MTKTENDAFVETLKKSIEECEEEIARLQEVVEITRRLYDLYTNANDNGKESRPSKPARRPQESPQKALGSHFDREKANQLSEIAQKHMVAMEFQTALDTLEKARKYTHGRGILKIETMIAQCEQRGATRSSG